MGAVHVAQLAMLLAECRPLNALWDLEVHGRCYSPSTAYTTTYIAFSKMIVQAWQRMLKVSCRPRCIYGSGLLGDSDLRYISDANEFED